MKIFATVALIALAGLGCAQEFGGPPQGRSDRQGRFPGSPVLPALDADSDGALSAGELAAAAAALRKLDSDGDGRLAQGELLTSPGAPAGRGTPEASGGASSSEMVTTLMAFDENGDGNLTRAEVPERMQGLFDRGDADADGVLTKEELTRLADAQVASTRATGRGGRRGDRGRTGGGFLQTDPVFLALDSDSDGSLSADEIGRADDALRTLDSDGDGALSGEELRPGLPFRQPPRQGRFEGEIL